MVLPLKRVDLEPILWAIIASLITAYGNIHNDYCDVKIDERNKKKNVFINPKMGSIYSVVSIVFILVSLILCLLMNNKGIALILAGVVTITLYLYNKHLKKIPLLGNIVVATLTSFIFIGLYYVYLYQFYFSYLYPGLPPAPYIALIVFSFVFTLIREVVKDAEDIEGDKANGVVTFAQLFPLKKIGLFITTISFLTVFLCFLHPSTFIKLSASLTCFIAIIGISTWNKTTQIGLKRLSSLYKIAMLAGLILWVLFGY